MGFGIGRRTGAVLLVLVPLISLSCAAPAELARRSQTSLEKGDAQEAFDLARKALNREPGNEAARQALEAAAQVRANDYVWRVRNIAQVDTVAAANYAREFTDFRRGLPAYRVSLAPDSAFDSDEAAVRLGAARVVYAQAEAALADGAPRTAYRKFKLIPEYVTGYRDATARAQEAFALAVVRVAVLPPVNETGAHGASEETYRSLWDVLNRDLAKRPYEFTNFVNPAEVESHVSLAQTRAMSRDDAVALGEALGADIVVRGRLYGQRSHGDRNVFRETIFHKEVERVSDGPDITRYVDKSFQAVVRERRVQVSWEVEALDVHRRVTLGGRGAEVEASARTVWTDFEPSGDCDDYCLLPPDVKRRDSDRWKRAERRWKDTFDTWTLPKFLDYARGHRSRGGDRWSRGSDGSDHRPLFMNGIPTDDELTLAALRGVGDPVKDMLRQLDEE
jgi:hypothetical protein